MNYISTKEAARKWGLTERSVRDLCQKGRVPNVKRSGRNWLIPDTEEKPLIGLKRTENEKRERFELYLNPTYCERNSLSTVTAEEIEICAATDDIMKGHFEDAEKRLQSLIADCTKDNYLAIAYATLYYSYFSSKSDSSFCISAMKELLAILDRNDNFVFGRVFSEIIMKQEREPVSLNTLPENMLPIATCFLISNQVVDFIAGRTQTSLAQTELLCRLAPDNISPAMLLLIHVNMCTGYFYANNAAAYSYHLEQALRIALPRRWYYPFAAYSYPNSWIEIKSRDEGAYREIQRLSDFVIGNYISSGFFKSNLSSPRRLSANTLRVAILLSRGLSNTKIAEMLSITLYEVKKCIREMYEDTGLKERDELAKFIRFHLKLI